MKHYFFYGLAFFLLSSCKPNVQADKNYVSENLVIKKVKDNVYEHTSYLLTNDFGKVPCNGMIVFDAGEAVVFDTPADDSTATVLINWIKDRLKCKVVAVIPTHFHADCLGGLQAFHTNQTPSYAANKTIDFAKTKKLIIPQHGFDKKLELHVGNREVIAEFNGEGHTKDNIIGYFPDQKVMFGGCLIKEVNATKGNLEDANVNDWSETVRKVKQKYPETELIIPGHGESGGQELFDYTIQLFKP
ncbi:subclass B1 metallo-beta-lactamase [Olivibacter sp. CPCC 100613]|uniref:subclass B1 metallo-beta-lactamase n=1 Tax=Olivibacter sp. CPCC 100613 TaxID=3079931 RepID=UPI002FF57481